METNPIYRLEMGQARRNGLLYLLPGIGCVTGLLLFLKGNDGVSAFLEFHPLAAGFFNGLPILFHLVGALVIVSISGGKLASQIIDGDLILKTPLSADKIFIGKLKTALALLFLYHATTLPGLVVLGAANRYHWIAGSMIGAVVTVCLVMVSLGFMAGARTPLLRSVLVFLMGLFLFCGFLVSCALAGVLILFLNEFIRVPLREFVAGFVVLSFFLAVSFGIFQLGIATFQRGPRLPEMLSAGFALFVIVSFMLFTVSLLLFTEPALSVFMMIPWSGFALSPLIAASLGNPGTKPPEPPFTNTRP